MTFRKESLVLLVKQAPITLILDYLMVSLLVRVVTGLKLTILVSTFLRFFLYQSGWRWDSLPEAYLNSAYMCTDTHALTEATMVKGIMPDAVPMLESQTDLDVDDFCVEIGIPPKEETGAGLLPHTITKSSLEGIPNDAMACSSNDATPTINTEVKSQELEFSDLKKRVCNRFVI